MDDNLSSSANSQSDSVYKLLRVKVFKNIKQTINLPESKFSNSPIILIFYEDAVTYYVLQLFLTLADSLFHIHS